MEFKSLADISMEDLFVAFSEAFKEYERSWSPVEFEKMLHRRSYNAGLSFGAFVNDRLVSFTLNGTGLYNTNNTVYDTGTGTIAAYRKEGLATRIFEASLPYLRQAGFSHYLLEVLQTNHKAISVYAHLGFTTSRVFHYAIQHISAVTLRKKMPEGYTLREISLQQESMMAMWDFFPAWQNSFAAVETQPDDFKTMGVFHNKALVGYGLIEISSGDIPQLAVHTTHRRKGLGMALVSELLQHTASTAVKCINTDAACTGITHFLAACNIAVRGKQLEMIKHL